MPEWCLTKWQQNLCNKRPHTHTSTMTRGLKTYTLYPRSHSQPTPGRVIPIVTNDVNHLSSGHTCPIRRRSATVLTVALEISL